LNVPVLAGAVIFVAIFIGGAAARALRRRQRDEIRSVHHYHDRLDTLHVEPHDRGGSVRVVAETELAPSHAEPGRPRVQLDGTTIGSPAVPTSSEDRTRHGRTWALGRMQPRARVDTATLLIVTIVLAALVALAVAGYLLRTDGGSTTTTTLAPSGHDQTSGLVVSVTGATTDVASTRDVGQPVASPAPSRSKMNA
jgi:hypothetical protein